jgi:hypothetical protein
VASQTGLDPVRLPNLTQITSRPSTEPNLDPVERLAGPIEQAIQRLRGEDAQAATYLWGPRGQPLATHNANKKSCGGPVARCQLVDRTSEIWHL